MYSGYTLFQYQLENNPLIYSKCDLGTHNLFSKKVNQSNFLTNFIQREDANNEIHYFPENLRLEGYINPIQNFFMMRNKEGVGGRLFIIPSNLISPIKMTLYQIKELFLNPLQDISENNSYRPIKNLEAAEALEKHYVCF